LKAVESLLNKSKHQSDVAAEIRKELRTDVQALRTEINTIEKEVTHWRDKYYALLEQYLKKYSQWHRPQEGEDTQPKT